MFLFTIKLFAEDIKLEFFIKGMTCPTCTRAVKLSIMGVSGVKSAKVYLNSESATVILEKSVSPFVIVDAVKRVGYTAELKL